MTHLDNVRNFQVFFQHEQQKLALYQDKKNRELFYYLLNVEEYTDVLPRAKQLIEQVQAKTAAEFPETATPRLFSLRASGDELRAALAELQHKYSERPSNSLDRKQLIELITQQAPLGLTDGCWLQNSSNINQAHQEVPALLFQIYNYKLGEHHREHNHFNLYQELLLSIPLPLSDLKSISFATQPELIDASYDLPTYFLALSQFPRLFSPEIVGVTLAHLLTHFDHYVLPLALLERHHLATHYFARVPSSQPHKSLAVAQQLVECYFANLSPELAKHHYRRIELGFFSSQVVGEKWKEHVEQRLFAPETLSSKEKMITLIAAKAPYSRGHHRYTLIGGKNLREWFKDNEFDAEAFLDALANSPFIDRDNPEESLFFSKLLSFGGPMFRVFTDDEIQVMMEWIKSLPDTQPEKLGKVKCPYPLPASQKPTQIEEEDAAPALSSGLRNLFYYLINIDCFPDATALAKKHVQKCLRRTKRYVPFLPGKLRFFKYSHDNFAERMHEIYEDQVSSYKSFSPPPMMSREAYIEGIRQLAPFVLVDGCWLQNVAQAGSSHTQVANYLFETFADEIGNGDLEWNHANVYRRLLQEENIELPYFDTSEFAHDPSLLRSAFELPVYQLAISLFPQTFLPELIGLNLAIEMSGLGGEYMTLVDELSYWDIDPYIVSLHLSIDNMASGHTAWAMQGVQIYLDHILSTQGGEQVQQHWKRIWLGFLSYRFVNVNLKLHLLGQFLRDKLYKKLGRRAGEKSQSPKVHVGS